MLPKRVKIFYHIGLYSGKIEKSSKIFNYYEKKSFAPVFVFFRFFMPGHSKKGIL